MIQSGEIYICGHEFEVTFSDNISDWKERNQDTNSIYIWVVGYT